MNGSPEWYSGAWKPVEVIWSAEEEDLGMLNEPAERSLFMLNTAYSYCQVPLPRSVTLCLT